MWFFFCASYTALFEPDTIVQMSPISILKANRNDQAALLDCFSLAVYREHSLLIPAAEGEGAHLMGHILSRHFYPLKTFPLSPLSFSLRNFVRYLF